MAQANLHTKPYRALVSVATLAIVIAAIGALLLFTVNPAQGANEGDSTTIGVGNVQSASTSLSAADRFKTESNAGSSFEAISDLPSETTVNFTMSSPRSIVVKDPDPVVVPVAVDETNPLALEKANEVCTLNPLPTAPHIAPDVNDGSWSKGIASAYNVATNDDGAGNFGVSTTASGIDLHDKSITVAVPESKSSLLGHIVEICYDDKVVIATVTDTGGFAKYGRDLDLAPGVYRAFGINTLKEWGTRTVYYRFL